MTTRTATAGCPARIAGAASATVTAAPPATTLPINLRHRPGSDDPSSATGGSGTVRFPTVRPDIRDCGTRSARVTMPVPTVNRYKGEQQVVFWQ
ncbi:hypothetical protein GCM10010399_88490 [Dactylosporangium fulvum]